MLKVRLFDTGQAAYWHDVLTGFYKQQAHCLLCYVLLKRDHLNPCECLAAQFWSDVSLVIASDLSHGAGLDQIGRRVPGRGDLR